MESVEIHGPTEVYLGDNITLECITGESFPGEHTLQCCQFAQPHTHGRAYSKRTQFACIFVIVPTKMKFLGSEHYHTA